MKFDSLSRLSFSAPIDNIDFFCYHRFRKNFKKTANLFQTSESFFMKGENERKAKGSA